MILESQRLHWNVLKEYKSEINRLTKDRTAEVNQVKVEKLKLEEDLRNATMEKKRLADTERILLNTFDTLKKYYDTKEKVKSNPVDDNPRLNRNLIKCDQCNYETDKEDELNKHVVNEH